MNRLQAALWVATLALSLPTAGAGAETELTCEDIGSKLGRQPTEAARQRFRDLEGACEGVVDIDGRLYMKTTAVVRQPGNRNIRLYLPATDHTFTVSPDAGSRVEIDGRKVRPRDLNRGQEFNIYVSVDEFTEPVIDRLAFLTENDELEEFIADLIAALPTSG